MFQDPGDAAPAAEKGGGASDEQGGSLAQTGELYEGLHLSAELFNVNSVNIPVVSVSIHHAC